jgi:hypothetical protein
VYALSCLCTGLNITSITDIGSGFDLLCDPVCLNDGQCRHNGSATGCVCPAGFAGVDCSDLQVPDGAVNLANRSFVANAGEVANMALSVVSANSRLALLLAILD